VGGHLTAGLDPEHAVKDAVAATLENARHSRPLRAAVDIRHQRSGEVLLQGRVQLNHGGPIVGVLQETRTQIDLRQQ
jgi:hypothetical protein